MKLFLTLSCAVVLLFSAKAQDTTWVQTFTFDTIVSRRAEFQFPASLDNQRFEKVLMYYKLKCSPLTTWDSYNCGEWDYLTYTRIFDHTGVMDSVRHDGWRYRLNTLSPETVSYRQAAYFDKRWKAVAQRTPGTVTAHPVTATAASPFAVMNSGSNGKTVQWIISASELAAAGAVMGDIQGLQLYFADAITRMEGVKISMKSSAAATLTAWETAGFTTVYDSELSGIVPGSGSIYFSTPYNWDGTSNVIVELRIADANPAASLLSVNAQQATAGSVLSYSNLNGHFRTTAANHAEINLSNFDLGNDMTIAFWAKGNGSFGTNTSIIEAVDSVGQRVLNIHMPWSDGSMYWDAGGLNGYDRISKVTNSADIENWHQWAFVKKASTGQMFIYRDGVQWHTGTALTRPVGKIAKFFLGSGANLTDTYKGDIDEFSVWTTALDAATIAAWKDKKIDASHPNYSALEVYYDFDDVAAVSDKSGNNRLGMCSADNMVQWAAYPVAGKVAGTARPEVSVIQGTMNAAPADSILTTVFPTPKVLFEYAPSAHSFHIVDNEIVYVQGTIDTLSVSGSTISSGASGSDLTITNDSIRYYEQAFEILHDVEIGRYITPYGIGFDLGPQGFTWIYDVTDYQKYLGGLVDLAAHNTQELVDIRFAFIEGTPPRDVHNIEPIWANFKSYNYAEMANDLVLSATPMILSDTSEMFSIKTRFSGHGQVGNGACCEWAPKDHKILIDGVQRFTWDIWEESACGSNPNTGQGGTWPYAREGWCPGDMVKVYDHELTSYVTPGDTVLIDYDITDVPANDMGQAGGNYIAALDLVSYSAPNFQHDAGIVDVLNPNKWEYYRKWNPTCSNPKVILQNTGALPLTKCKIRCWVTYGNWQEFEWTGNLGFLEKEMVEIPLTNAGFWFGVDMANPVFNAQVYSVEGTPDLDEYAQNNVFTTRFEAVESINNPFFVYFKTNNKAAENKWKLVDNDGATIFERLTLANTTEYRDTFDLAPGCYSIILEDSDDDGIGFWYSSQVEGETAGQFRLRNVGGGFIETFPTDFGKYHRYDFSVGFTLGTETKGAIDENILIFPNPATDNIRAEFNGFLGKEVVVQVLDAKGRVLRSVSAQSEGSFVGIDLPVTDLTNGLYFITIQGSEGARTAQFIKQ